MERILFCVGGRGKMVYERFINGLQSVHGLLINPSQSVFYGGGGLGFEWLLYFEGQPCILFPLWFAREK